MLKLSKKADYGLTLLVILEKSGKKGYQSVKKIAEENKLPYKFLGQIASRLHEKGILESKEGKAGGIRLSRQGEYIWVIDVIEALDKSKLKKCVRGENCDCEPFCVEEKIVAEVAGLVEQRLSNMSVADLLKNNKKEECGCGGMCSC